MENIKFNEVVDLIKEGKYEKALELMVEVQPLKDCEQNNPHHVYNVFDHIIKSVEYVEYGFLSVVSNITLEERKQWFINNEDVLLTILKLVMLLHDVGKPNVKTINQKTGFDSFIKHEKESEEIANKILPDDFNYKEVVLCLIKNHEYINENTCNNKKSIRKKYKALDENANLMFMLPMLRLADISAQSDFAHASKFQQSIDFINTLEEVIAE